MKTLIDRDELIGSIQYAFDGLAESDGYESGWNDALDKIGGSRR